MTNRKGGGGMISGEAGKVLKISGRAWHLRLVRFWNRTYSPKNLCPYVWVVSSYLFWSVGLIMTLPVFGPLMAIIYLLFRFYSRYATDPSNWDDEIVPMTGKGFLGLWLASLLFPLTVTGATLGILGDVWYQHRGPAETKQTHKPSLIWEFIKAKKRKVCPMIEIEKE